MAEERPSSSRDRPAKMNAAVVTCPGSIRIEEVDIPQPGTAEVRVQLEGCGVCASNLPPWEGRPWFNYPMQPGWLGHEGWGIVDAVGPEVTDWQPGDRVAMLSQKAYAEYDVAPADALVRLPQSVAGLPFPGEPLGCAMNILRRSEINSGDCVAIIGIGFLGALLTSLAWKRGASVIAISRRDYSLWLARSLGAADATALDDHWRIIDHVRSLTGGRMCDVTIEAVGQQWPLDLAAELTRERGRMIVAGYHQDGTRQVNMQLWNWRGLDVINAHERETSVYVNGIRAAVDAVADGTLDPTPLYTHSFSLDRLGDALNATRDRPDGFVKALIRLKGWRE